MAFYKFCHQGPLLVIYVETFKFSTSMHVYNTHTSYWAWGKCHYDHHMVVIFVKHFFCKMVSFSFQTFGLTVWFSTTPYILAHLWVCYVVPWFQIIDTTFLCMVTIYVLNFDPMFCIKALCKGAFECLLSCHDMRDLHIWPSRLFTVIMINYQQKCEKSWTAITHSLNNRDFSCLTMWQTYMKYTHLPNIFTVSASRGLKWALYVKFDSSFKHSHRYMFDIWHDIASL